MKVQRRAEHKKSSSCSHSLLCLALHLSRTSGGKVFLWSTLIVYINCVNKFTKSIVNASLSCSHLLSSSGEETKFSADLHLHATVSTELAAFP